MLAHIHIGLHKTGTSTIQHFLHHNRSLLLQRQSTLYPASVCGLTLDSCDHNPLTYLPLARTLPLLQTEIKSADPPPQHLIISAEILSIASTPLSDMEIPDFINALHALGSTQIQVIVYVRDIPSLLNSMCSQSLRASSNLPWERLHPRDNPEAGIIFDTRAILERWIAVCGREHIRVRLFEPQSWVNGDLLHDAVDALDLRWDEDFVIPPRQNERLNLLEMEILRALNHFMPYAVYARPVRRQHAADGSINIYPDHGSQNPKYCLWQHLSRHTSKLKGEQLRFAVPKATLEAYLDYFANSEEWVRREFFPERPYLFDRPDLSAYQENPVLRDPRPEHWQALARTLIDLGQENGRLRAQMQKLQRQVQELHSAADKTNEAGKT